MRTATRFEPKDRTKTFHLGVVASVRWEDPDQPRIILILRDGASAVGSATRDQFADGQQYKFLGRWTESKFGPQFEFSAFVTDVPHSRTAVVRYLSETCRGVGKVTAERAFDKWGSDAVRIFREEPKTVAGAGLLGPEACEQAAEDLARFARFEDTKVALFGLFAGRGFPGKTIDVAIRTFGVEAPDRIRRDPFTMLVRKFPGAGWKRCDALNTHLNHPADDPKRQSVAAWHLMREDRTGSTWLDAGDVADELVKLIPTADPLRALRTLIRAGWARVRRAGAERYVALRDRADAERRVATAVARLTRSPATWPAEIPVSVREGDGLPSVHQRDELRKATAAAVGCFIGGPGTGKTHSLSFVLKAVAETHGPGAVLVCAPTGKAAVRAAESLRARGLEVEARTIHQTLEITRNGHDGDGWGFARDRDNPLDCRFLVVDESSMIDAGLMADLLDAVPDGAGVLLVGDPYQLPPVGHGAPLRDMLAGGVAFGELTEVRRNSGSIVRACQDIKAGRPVRFDAAVDLEADDKKNLRHIDCEPADAPELLEEVLEQVAARFDQKWETQILCATNDKSELSRSKINERLARILNPDGREARGNPFRVGDKVICGRNTRLKRCRLVGRFKPEHQVEQSELAANYLAETSNDESAQVYVANGEIGRVVAVGEKHSVVRFGASLAAPLVVVPVGKGKRDDDGGDSPAASFDLAWAITGHKSQGSEWPCVIGLVDPAGGQVADRNWWYTVISRARSLCVLIGPRGAFDRQVTRQAVMRRRTFLADMLRSPAADPQPDEVTA